MHPPPTKEHNPVSPSTGFPNIPAKPTSLDCPSPCAPSIAGEGREWEDKEKMPKSSTPSGFQTKRLIEGIRVPFFFFFYEK